ncbi:MAG: IMP cyclohydrolase [Deltaproteobacteria bacterium]|nr:IMP cyclohydrolase [Deltaproteobacteria bacterium]MBW2070555.1 IMP cyclohydrolase [Deltaproteobacteria bacterium]
MRVKIQRAILSVTDKSGLVPFARSLGEMAVEILSTGGTARQLREGGIEVRDISDFTGFPEMLDGRVKTLHPKVHAGILAQRDNPAHMQTMAEHDLHPIDMVVVNLYAFEKAVARQGCTLEEAVENIDIGGPTLLRAAAKNYRHVAVVVDPADYDGIIAEMRANDGALSLESRFKLAKKVFRLTHEYDGAISRYLEKVQPDIP